MPITPAVDLDGLLLLLPHELMGLAIIVGMLAIAIGRNHFVSTVIATSCMLAAGIAGAMQFYELTLGAAPTLFSALLTIPPYRLI